MAGLKILSSFNPTILSYIEHRGMVRWGMDGDMKLDKRKFKTYLRSIPNNPFCKNDNCPIAQYFLDVHSKKVAVEKGIVNGASLPRWAVDFVWTLDMRLYRESLGVDLWTRVTPSQCLEILDVPPKKVNRV